MSASDPTPTPAPQPSKLAGAAAQLGPGLITGAADDDPSGIATYSQAGAQFGYAMLWTMVFTLPLMAAIQMVSARIGFVTGRGLARNVARHAPRPVLVTVVGLLVIANTLNIAADLAAMAEALRLVFGGPAQAYAVALGLGSLGLQVALPYARYVRVLKWLTLALLSYVAVAFSVHVDWPRVAAQLVSPDLPGGLALCFTETDPVRELFWSAVLNGVVAVPIMATMMVLAGRREIMGEHVIGPWLKTLGWTATAVMTAVVGAMLATA